MKTLTSFLLFLLFSDPSLCAQSFTTFSVAGPKVFTGVTALNDSGEVVGTWDCPKATFCGFLRDSQGVIHKLGPHVDPSAINASGEFVGTYKLAAFYRQPNGKMTQYLRLSEPSAAAINAAGFIAGSYCINCNHGGETVVAYLMNPKGAISTVFSPPEGIAWVTGMNNSNQIVGEWAPSFGPTTQAFLITQGVVDEDFGFPGAVATYPAAINDGGEVIGTWKDSEGNQHGFYWTEQTGFTSFDPPNSVWTVPIAINASGEIVGDFYTTLLDGLPHGFVMTSDGALSVFNVPHSKLTALFGVNSKGLIAGDYQISNKEGRAFIYTPAK